MWDIKIDNLPGLEALQIPGTKNEQNKMIRQGNTVELYQWDISNNIWNKVCNSIYCILN